MLATITCGLIFLTVKLAYEWPQKFEHFGAYIKPGALAKYEKYLGNERRLEKGLEPRIEITGHLHSQNATEYEVALDPVNADPDDPAMDRPHFIPLPVTDKIATIEKADVQRATMFLPTHSAYFASYFTITGLHGLHVLGGVIVFIYMISSDDFTGERSASQSVFFCILLLILGGLPAFVGIVTSAYLAIELVLGGLFIAVAMRFLRLRTREAARLLFITSIVYLPLLLAALVLTKS